MRLYLCYFVRHSLNLRFQELFFAVSILKGFVLAKLNEVFFAHLDNYTIEISRLCFEEEFTAYVNAGVELL